MYKIFIGACVLVVMGACVAFAINNEGAPRRVSDDLPVAATIVVTRNGFLPTEVTIKKGEAIRLVSGETADCDLRLASCFFWPASDPHPSHEFYSEFDPREPLGPGEAWTFVFDRAGNWGFHDHFNPSNRGTVRVTEGAVL